MESFDDRAAMPIEQHLTDDGIGDQTDLLSAEPCSQHFPHESLKPLVLRADESIHQLVQRFGRFDHFPRHDPAVVAVRAVLGDAGKELADEVCETLFRRKILDSWGGSCIGAAGRRRGGFVEHGGVKRTLVPKVIADGRDVGPCSVTDLADGRITETILGEDRRGGGQELPPGGCGLGA